MITELSLRLASETDLSAAYIVTWKMADGTAGESGPVMFNKPYTDEDVSMNLALRWAHLHYDEAGLTG